MNRILARLDGSTWVPQIAGFCFVAGLVLLLQLAVTREWVSPFLISAPLDIARSLRKLIENEGLLQRCLATFVETLATSVLAIGVGVSAGYAMNRWRIAYHAYVDWVVAIAAAPVILIYPLFLVVFGRSMWTIIAMSFLSAVTPIVLKTCEGLNSTHRVLIDVGRSFDLTPSQQFWMIQFPAAVPAIFTGIRLGMIYALLSVIGLEYLIDFGGLGQLVADLADRFELPAMYGAIFFVVVVSASFLTVLQKIENRLRPV